VAISPRLEGAEAAALGESALAASGILARVAVGQLRLAADKLAEGLRPALEQEL
jgi:hypothetical protein